MKITLPEHIGEITLGQFQRYHELNKRTDLSETAFNKRKIVIFTELKQKDIKYITQTDYEEIIEDIDQALELTPKFEQRFKIKDIEFGMIPNFDKMTTGEFADLDKYSGDVDKLHRLIAILFRPVTEEDVFKNYKIKDYNGTEGMAELMKLTPMHAVNGALDFFLNLSKELQKHTQRYTNQERRRVKQLYHILKSGDGTQVSLN